MTAPAHPALTRLETIPRAELCVTPTPLLLMRNLAKAIAPNGPRLFRKMEAWTGLGLGGNKLRKLEYHLAPERIRGVSTVITCGGTQSNHARLTAAAAAHLGLRCILVLNGEEESPHRGNALLHRLFGAEIRFVESREDREAAMMAASEEEGGDSMIIPLGASTPLGVLGYLRCALELDHELGLGIKDRPGRTVVVVPSSSCGTLSGLLLGLSILDWDRVRLLGVSADEPTAVIDRTSATLASRAAELLGWDGDIALEAVSATDREVGSGYGIPTEASAEALDLFARLEGALLDPFYTAKAAAALLGELREGRFTPDDTVVFLHTGGHPALFL